MGVNLQYVTDTLAGLCRNVLCFHVVYIYLEPTVIFSFLIVLRVLRKKEVAKHPNQTTDKNT